MFAGLMISLRSTFNARWPALVPVLFALIAFSGCTRKDVSEARGRFGLTSDDFTLIKTFQLHEPNQWNADLRMFSGYAINLPVAACAGAKSVTITSKLTKGAGDAYGLSFTGNQPLTKSVNLTLPGVMTSQFGLMSPTDSHIRVKVTTREGAQQYMDQSDYAVLKGGIVVSLDHWVDNIELERVTAQVAATPTSSAIKPTVVPTAISGPLTATIASSAAMITSVSPIPFSVTFGASVADFTSADITVVNGTVTNFSGSGSTYTFDLVPSGQGTVSVDVGAGVSHDSVSNANAAAAQVTRTFDSIAPTGSLTSSSSGMTNLASIPVTVTFSETVTGFDGSKLTLGNASVSNFAGSGSAYTFDLVPTANGAFTVAVGAAKASDPAGNSNTASNTLSLTSDRSGPNQPAAPTGPSSPLLAANITFSWTAPADVGAAGVNGYNLQVGTSAGGNNTFDGAVAGTSQSIAVVAGNTYYARVQAVDALGNLSAWSANSTGIAVNTPPTISITSPSSGNAMTAKNSAYSIQFTSTDPDNAAAISLYYRTVSSNCTNGSLTGWTLISSALVEGTDSSYSWSGAAITAGIYYICAKINDSVNTAVYALSGGTIQFNTIPTMAAAYTSNSVVTAGSNIDFTVTVTDPEDDVTFSIYLTNGTAATCAAVAPANRQFISGPHLKSGGAVVGTIDTTSWTSTVPQICVDMNDGVNPVTKSVGVNVWVYRVCNWTGSVSSTWSVAGNWTGCGGSVPLATDMAFIAGATNPQPVVTSGNAAVGGFAGGAGSATVTINPGAGLVFGPSIGAGSFIDYDVTIRGATDTCTTCYLYRSNINTLKVRNGATLRLETGLSYVVPTYSMDLMIGDGTTYGNLVIRGRSGDGSTYSSFGGGSYANRGGSKISVQGTASNPSTIDIDGFDFKYNNTAGGLIDLKSNFSVVQLKNIKFYGADPTVAETSSPVNIMVESCAGSTTLGSPWTGLYMQDIWQDAGTGYGISMAANCSSLGPLNVGGSGHGYAALFEKDPSNVVNWVTGTSETCVWTGAVNDSWTNAGNWNSCANGRDAYPDGNDWVIVPGAAATQPTIRDGVATKGFATGSGGGTISIDVAGALSLVNNAGAVASDVAIQGTSINCATCTLYLAATGNGGAQVVGDATLTFKQGLRIWSPSNPIDVGATGTSGGRLRLSGGGSSDPTTWPTWLGAYQSGVVKLQGTAGLKAKLDMDGFRAASTQSYYGFNVPVNGVSNYTIENFDRFSFDAPFAGPVGTRRIAQFSNCTPATFLDTNWTDIWFKTAIVATDFNIRFVSCTGMSASMINVQAKSGATPNAGFGAAYASDPANSLVWIP